MGLPPAGERRDAVVQIAALSVLALLLRAWFAATYYGWEEGDYGNLMMVREVQDSGFTWFRTAHMPGWYVLGAAVREVLPFPRLAPLLPTIAFSVANVAVAALLTRKLAGASAAWLVGLWLCFQPEMVLYGASTLRSPVYTSLSFWGLAFLLWGARDRGFAVVALGFLTRMEGFFVFYIPALWAWARDLGRGWRSLFIPAALLGGVVLGWQAYITFVHDEGFFVLGPLNINMSDVADASPEGTFELGVRLREGFDASWSMLSWLMPRKLGWAWVALSALGAVAVLRDRARTGGRAVAVFGAFALAFWLAEGFLSKHDPNHNLLWVWMMPIVPLLGVLAGLGWSFLERRLKRGPAVLRPIAWLAIALSVAPAFAHEVQYQADRSERWYRPQLDLSRWMEDSLPPDAGVLVGSIPEVWLKRLDSPLRVYAWAFLPGHLDGGDKDTFGEYLNVERIDYVLWFAEEWNDSNRIAPWLREGVPVYAGPVALTPVDREDGYGWILYAVGRPGVPTPPVAPRYGQGVRGPGWGP